MPQSYTCLFCHRMFSTKDREPWLQPELRPRPWECLCGALRSEGGFCLLANGVVDHVHLLTRLRQGKAVSQVLRSIKANSSGWIHEAFPKLRGFHWQAGYGAFTVSQPQTGTVRRYIANQQAHHCKLTFSRRISGTPEGTLDRVR
jgi:REP element-mobilizing transposase RayT